jgi:hypothetical protein
VRTPREEAENAAMRSLRVSIEWPYETVTNLFKILESKYNKQLLGRNREPNTLIGKQLHVVFLYNLYVCLHGSKFSRFFDVVPPTLEEYLGIEIDED